MKTSELKVNQHYVVKLEKATICKLVEILPPTSSRRVTHFKVLNLDTKRLNIVKSPLKFLRLAPSPSVAKAVLKLPPSGTVTGQSVSPTPLAKEVPKVSALAKLVAQTEAYKAPHVIVLARAGTGKTTTLEQWLKVLRGVPTDIKPSLQQKVIWDTLSIQKELCKTVGFCAFNKSIATELERRVGHLGCEAMTIHRLGLKTVQSAYNLRQPDDKRVERIVEELTGTSIVFLRRDKPELVLATKELVKFVKANLTGWDGERLLEASSKDWRELLLNLSDFYDIPFGNYQEKILELVPIVIHRCLDVRRDGFIDFDDMVWIPVVCNLVPPKYDLLIIDEAQDLNPCQQALVIKSGTRLALVGDDYQAIYGFTGADNDSLFNMRKKLETLGEVVTLPLTVTRRCGKAIVKKAQEIVRDFQAHESNPEGKVDTSLRIYPKEQTGSESNNYLSVVAENDMVLCRTNAPLISQCFKLLRMERKAVVRGRDIAAGLTSVIDKMKAASVEELSNKLDTFFSNERKKENAKKFPNENKLQGLEDRQACLEQFIEGASTVAEVLNKIDRVFSDTSTGAVVFSSIHKAKGLEANNVFLLATKKANVKAKTPQDKQQERNLYYVAVTRAKNCFYEVFDLKEEENEEKPKAVKPQPTSKSTVPPSSFAPSNRAQRYGFN